MKYHRSFLEVIKKGNGKFYPRVRSIRHELETSCMLGTTYLDTYEEALDALVRYKKEQEEAERKRQFTVVYSEEI